MSETRGTRVAVVTGAGTGIGAAVCRRLTSDQYAVALVGRRREPIDQVASDLGELALVVAADVGIPADTRRVIDTTVDRFGGIDVLVNSAGIATSSAVLNDTPKRWDEVLRVNLTGTFLMARAALPHLIERRGAIVNVASVNAWQAGPEQASYCASKAGVVMLTRSLAIDYGPAGVRSNCICPGWVRTPMADDDIDTIAALWGVDREAGYRLSVASNPLRRPAEPDDIASVVSFLAGPDARYVNGVTIPLDGGANVVDDAYSCFQGPTGFPDHTITPRHPT